MSTPRDLLLHPIRLRLVQALVGAPATPQELKDRLGDVAQATLYRHLNVLTEGGLVTVVDERSVRGGVERTYGVVEAAVALSPDDVADATPEEHLRYFATFAGALLSDFGAYLDQPDPDLGRDRIGYRQLPMWLSDQEVDDLTDALRDLLAPLFANEPTPERRRRLLTTIFMPAPTERDTEQS